MKNKTSELTGAALDWAVARCESVDVLRCGAGPSQYLTYIKKRSAYVKWCPSTNWSQGGTIIERECIFIAPTWDGEKAGSSARSSRTAWIEGPTPLVAAMRCYVASKLGEDVDVPEELLTS